MSLRTSMPSGTPRPYAIHFGRHAMERQAERDIPVALVEDTVRSGSERPLPGKGTRGGMFRRYTKLRSPGRTVVVIAELVGNDCYLITTYEEADTTRN